MTRHNENSEDIRGQNEHQHGWEHIPSNDNYDIVSPSSQFQQRSEPTDNASPLPTKGAGGPYEVEILDPAPQLKKRKFLSEWWQEILSAISSILCLVAIAVILYKVNRKPLADWDAPVSLNAAISILSTAVKAGLILPVAECISQLKWIHLQSSKSHLEQLQVFDNASRGPAGSLWFFLQARRAPLVSYFACLIVILAVALDPFTQQIIKFYQSSDTPVAHTNSTVSHSQVYDRDATEGIIGEKFKLMDKDRLNDDNIMFGMVSGLYGTLPAPPFSCPGSNCTYPVVNTLGICNHCEDVTERTGADCVIWPYINRTISDRLSACNYTLPGNINISLTESYTTWGLNYPTLNTSAADFYRMESPFIFNSIVNMTNIPTVYNMSFVRVSNSDEIGMNKKANGTDWMKTMTAQECRFELCAWSFTNWSHHDGSLREGSVAQSRFRVVDPIVETRFWNNSAPYVFETVDTDFPGNQTYTVANFDRKAIIQTFYTMWDRDTGNKAATYFANSLYRANHDVPRTLDAMARGMTYSMMNGTKSTLSMGQVFETQTYIQVRWEWLTLSIITVLSAVALLTVTIVKTYAAHQRAWKSSLAPLLYADSTLVPRQNGSMDWSEEDKVQRKAIISTGLLAASAAGAAAVIR